MQINSSGKILLVKVSDATLKVVASSITNNGNFIFKEKNKVFFPHQDVFSISQKANSTGGTKAISVSATFLLPPFPLSINVALFIYSQCLSSLLHLQKDTI